LIIKDCLLHLGIPIEKCREQALMGQQIFKGVLMVLLKKIESENPATISVLCLAHCVNL